MRLDQSVRIHEPVQNCLPAAVPACPAARYSTDAISSFEGTAVERVKQCLAHVMVAFGQI